MFLVVIELVHHQPEIDHRQIGQGGDMGSGHHQSVTLEDRARIEERLYGWGEEVESNAVEVHIHGLRRKLGADYILNVRGVGYRVPPT